MANSSLPHLTTLAAAVVFAAVAYQLLQYVVLARKRQALIREKGALPISRLPQQERILGLQLFRENMRFLKEHKILERSYNRFKEMGVGTFSFCALGRTMYITIEPENLKTIQAVEFKKWGLGKRRKVGFRPLLGDGIFTTDGAAWAHSRLVKISWA